MPTKKALGKTCNGINLKKAGDVYARGVCRGKITQAQAYKLAQKMIDEIKAGNLLNEEDTIVQACADIGIGRRFAGV